MPFADYAEDFACGWLPPIRKRERGSRSLGDTAPVVIDARPVKVPKSAQPAPSHPEVVQPAAARKKEPMTEAARAAMAAEEARAWELADGLVLSDEQRAMLRMLHELFSAKFHSFSRPFLIAAEAEAIGVACTLPDIRKRFVQGEFETLGPFCAEVRDVFAQCYMAHGRRRRRVRTRRHATRLSSMRRARRALTRSIRPTKRPCPLCRQTRMIRPSRSAALGSMRSLSRT